MEKEPWMLPGNEIEEKAVWELVLFGESVLMAQPDGSIKHVGRPSRAANVVKLPME